MDDDKKRIVKIVLAVGCLALAGVITFYQFGGGGGTGSMSDRLIYLKCLNKSCDHVEETNTKEFSKILEQNQGPLGMGMEMGPMRFDCLKCGKKSMVTAEKCPKCDTVFVQNPMATKDYPDRCPNPDCKYSDMEEQMNQR